MVMLFALALMAQPVEAAAGTLPLWLVGNWCNSSRPQLDPLDGLRWHRSAHGIPEWGGMCMRWKKQGKRLVGERETGLSGLPNPVFHETMEIVKGRLVYRSGEATPFVEFDSGPNDLTFERTGPEGREGERWVLEPGGTLLIFGQYSP